MKLTTATTVSLTASTIHPQPTAHAIAEGMRAAQGKSHLYNIGRIAPESRSFWVARKAKTSLEGYYVMTGYRNSTDRHLSAVNCGCERFQFVDVTGAIRGYCSHCAMVEEILRIEDMELAFDEQTEGRFCVQAGKF